MEIVEHENLNTVLVEIQEIRKLLVKLLRETEKANKLNQAVGAR